MDATDIVIPYVDGNAAGYRELCAMWNIPFVPCQMRQFDELRYLFRSLKTHLDFAARIILAVQSTAHLPAWLNQEKVRVVCHHEFIPPSLMPTFHWATISAHLYRIDGLSEQFIIWEDDILLGRRLSLSRFFDAQRLPKMIYSAPILPRIEPRPSAYRHNLLNTRELLRRHFASPSCFIYPHAPLPSRKTSWLQLHQQFQDEAIFTDSISRRHRGDEIAQATIDPTVLYANWQSLSQAGTSRIAHYFSWLHHRDFAKYAVVNNYAKMSRHMRGLRDSKRLFLNLNDEAYDGPFGTDINPQSLDILDVTLRARYPHKSPQEC